MRVALCLSGLIRDFENSGHTYNEYLCKDLGCDVFVHTWEENEESSNTRFCSSTMQNPKNKNEMFSNIFPDSNVSTDIQDFNSDWNFRREHNNDIFPRTTAIMYYSIYRSNLLKKKFEQENNFTYDVVIRSRMDFLLNQRISKTELDHVLNHKDDVHVGTNLYHKGENSHRMSWQHIDGQTLIEDQFAFASSTAMDKYSNCYMENSNMQSEGGEIILGKQFDRHRLKPIRTSFRFKALQHAFESKIIYWEDYEEIKQVTFNRGSYAN